VKEVSIGLQSDFRAKTWAAMMLSRITDFQVCSSGALDKHLKILWGFANEDGAVFDQDLIAFGVARRYVLVWWPYVGILDSSLMDFGIIAVDLVVVQFPHH
jgi:hypothetical protein